MQVFSPSLSPLSSLFLFLFLSLFLLLFLIFPSFSFLPLSVFILLFLLLLSLLFPLSFSPSLLLFHSLPFPPLRSPPPFSTSPKGDYIYTVVDHSSRALVEVEDIESHPGVAFPKHVFGEQETVAMATWAVSTANVKHAFLVILLDNVYHKSEKYIFVAQTE